MYFPSERLNLPKAMYKIGNKIFWFDNNNEKHAGVVLDVRFGTLATGWYYLLKLNDPYYKDGKEFTNIKAREHRIQKQ